MRDGGLAGRNFNRNDWIGIVACVLIGISVTDAVGSQVHATMDFWPAFGIKVAVGSAVTMVLLVVWLGLIRRKS